MFFKFKYFMHSLIFLFVFITRMFLYYILCYNVSKSPNHHNVYNYNLNPCSKNNKKVWMYLYSFMNPVPNQSLVNMAIVKEIQWSFKELTLCKQCQIGQYKILKWLFIHKLKKDIARRFIGSKIFNYLTFIYLTIKLKVSLIL